MSWAFTLPVVAVLLWAAWTYNRFIRLRNQVSEAWAGIDVQLQRRYDNVPAPALEEMTGVRAQLGSFDRQEAVPYQAEMLQKSMV